MHILVLIGLASFVKNLALGLEGSRMRAETVDGFPCVKRLNQLYCPSPGRGYPSDNILLKPQVTHNSSTYIFHTEVFADSFYPSYNEDEEDHEGILSRTKRQVANEADQVLRRVKRDLIDMYIDENKALVKRMFGEYAPPSSSDANDVPSSSKVKTFDGSPLRGKNRGKRSHKFNDSNKVDTCESAVEIVTPYWASNSAGKIRAIVNTQHLQQAIQQEVCQSTQTKRCRNDCSCEQKYKWHRLLAYDPDDDCKGIFMDWFLFPSCCVCRCVNPLIS